MEMKFIVCTIFLFSLSSFGKCLVVTKEEFIKRYKTFIYGEVVNANFSARGILRKTKPDSKHDLPYFEIKVNKVLKGEVKEKLLKVLPVAINFGYKMFPNPLYKVRNNLMRVFAVKWVKENGSAAVITNACTPILDINDFN